VLPFLVTTGGSGFLEREIQMLKRLAFIVAMLFIPALAKADSFLSVVITSDNLGMQLPGENITDSFVWDTTTNI
jgi:hypothetical protein